MVKNFKNYAFKTKAGFCSVKKAYKHLLAVNEPEFERFFSRENQNKIVDLLLEAREQMQRYRDVKAHDYVIEDFGDECVQRLPMASECVARPNELELQHELQILFPSVMVYEKWSKNATPVWRETLAYWVEYVCLYWEEIFGHEMFIVASCYR